VPMRHCRESLTRSIILLVFAASLSGLGGCTLMLAGAVVKAIVTEVKSKEKVPEKNEVVYLIAAQDPREKITYLVEAHVKTNVDLKLNVMVLYVVRIVISYEDRKHGQVVLIDVEGDGFLDEVLYLGRKFYPPVAYSSGEYMLQVNNGSLKGGVPRFIVGLEEGNPWYRFSERSGLREPPVEDAAVLNAFPFQQRFDLISTAALKELDFHAHQDGTLP